MKNITAIIFSLHMLAIAVGAENVKHTALEECEKRTDVTAGSMTLENQLLDITLYPAFTGGVDNIRWKKTDTRLLRGGRYVQIEYGPLLQRIKPEGVLFCEKFWSAYNGSAMVGMEIIQQDSDSIVLHSNQYAALPVSLTRKITMKPGESMAHFDVQLSQLKGHAIARPLKPWLNLMPNCNIKWQTRIPARGGDLRTGLGQSTSLPKDAIYEISWQQNEPNCFLCPARQWIALLFQEPKLALAIMYDVNLEESTFYSWTSVNPKRPGKTIEMIFPSLSPDKEGMMGYSYRLAVFPGLDDIKAICDDTAIEVQCSPDSMKFVFSAARPFPAREVQLWVNGAKAGTQELPPMKPGTLAELIFKTKPEGEIDISIGGDKSRILETLQLK